MADNPFVVQIPEGATEIDLTPILRPLIHAIREEIRAHDSRAHRIGDRDKRADELEPTKISDWFYSAADELRYQEQVRKINRETLIACLKDKDWVEVHPGSCEYVRPYYFNGNAWDYKGDRIRLTNPQHHSLRVVHEVVRQLSYKDQVTKLEMANIVLSYDNVLDRIVKEID